ncbi:MAG: thiolase family protein [Alphaproteobacteria bacterium]|nr:thiolase family protein [Alphaproteobacteria bacterium]
MTSARDEIYVIGVGMTPFGRHPEKSVKELTALAVDQAMRDANCDRRHIGAAFFGCASEGFLRGQWLIGGQVALLPLGFEGVPIFNVENGCATASTAFHLAVNTLKAGEADFALAVGVDKMRHPDKAKSFAFFEGGWDVETPEANAARIRALAKGFVPPPDARADRQYSPFMDVYSSYARAHMTKHGLTQRQLAVIASKNHGHAASNARAQHREPMSVEAVLKAQPISYPLTLPMCAPLSDGAAAAVLCTGAALERHDFGRRRAVRVLASVMKSATSRDGDEAARHICRRTADAAYARAGLGPEDMDVAEVHDASAMGELIQTENLGFCPLGEGGALAESGATAIGGRIPVNPSGGLESKGHPVGATGLGQIFELVSQLRGECGERQIEGARIAIQENGGGLWGIEEASAHVGIFARD